jgi:glycosyltransferase involved in cell wall biosynthesis
MSEGSDARTPHFDNNGIALQANPLMSVVTVVLNCAQHIEETIKSIISQTYQPIEFIVIDGASTDGTIDILHKYSDEIDYFLSERDGGIYYAMNKAINISKGEWIIFMNAGDRFFSERSIQDAFALRPPDADMVYGFHKIQYQNGYIRVPRLGPLDSIWKEIPFSHQSLFTKTFIMKKYLFNAENRLIADYEFVYKAYNAGYTISRVNTVVAVIRTRGMTDIHRMEGRKALWKTSMAESGHLWKHFYFFYLMVDCLLRIVLKRILPERIIDRIVRNKSRHLHSIDE